MSDTSVTPQSNETLSTLSPPESDSNSSEGEPLSATLPAILVGMCGLGGNAFVIFVVLRFPKLRRRLTSTFLLNQTIADFTASGVMVAHYITRYLWSFHVNTGGIAGELYCRLWLTSFPLFGVMLASTFNLMSITLERYMMVIHPVYHKNKFTRRKAFFLIAFSWVFGVGYHAFWAPYSTRLQAGDCYIFATWPNVRTAELYAVLTVLFHLFLPVVLLGFMYTRIIFVLQRKPRTNQIAPNVQPQHSVVTRVQANLIKTLVVVVVGFILCWTLNQMYWFLFNLGYVTDPGSDVHTLSVTFVYINCCVNPFIYIFKYEEFRQGMRRIFRGRHKQPQFSSSSTGNPQHGKS